MASEDFKGEMSKRTIPMIKTLCPFAVLALLSRVDATQTATVTNFYLYFVVSNLAVILLWMGIAQMAKNSDDKRIVTIKQKSKDEWKYTKRPKGEKQTKTVSEYDSSQCWTKVGGVGFNAAVCVLIHTQTGYFLPILVVGTLAMIDLIEAPLVKIYLRGMNEKDHLELKRPFNASFFPTMASLQERIRKAELATEAKKRAESQPAGISTEERSLSKEELERRERKKAKRLASKGNKN